LPGPTWTSILLPMPPIWLGLQVCIIMPSPQVIFSPSSMSPWGEVATSVAHLPIHLLVSCFHHCSLKAVICQSLTLHPFSVTMTLLTMNFQNSPPSLVCSMLSSQHLWPSLLSLLSGVPPPPILMAVYYSWEALLSSHSAWSS
jgi:hypothetical protein